MGQVRLYVEQELGAGQTVRLARAQAHYLFGVMRLSEGDRLEVFDGRSGAWAAEVSEAGKRGGALAVLERTRAPLPRPDLWLLFAPLKKARTDFVVEKATELGAARIVPVQTDFTNAERIRRDRLQAHAVEAAEQCGGTYVPPVEELRRLSDALSDWPVDRHLVFADEALVGARRSLSAPQAEKWAILIGPEGGFSDDERARLSALPFVTPISLGPRILRADTAAVAAMTLWQSTRGDWV